MNRTKTLLLTLVAAAAAPVILYAQAGTTPPVPPAPPAPPAPATPPTALPPIPPQAPEAPEPATNSKRTITVQVNNNGKETSIVQNSEGITVIYPGKDGEKVEVKASSADELKSSPEAYQIYRKYVLRDNDSPRVRVITPRSGVNNEFRFSIPPIPPMPPMPEIQGLSPEQQKEIERALKDAEKSTEDAFKRAEEGHSRALEGHKRAIEGQQRAIEGQRRAIEGQRRALEDRQRTLNELQRSPEQSPAESPSTPRLGVQVEELDEAIQSHLGSGVIILEVVEGSRAEKLGLQENDIIRSINGQPTPDAETLRELVRSANGPFKLEITRAGKPLHVEESAAPAAPPVTPQTTPPATPPSVEPK